MNDEELKMVRMVECMKGAGLPEPDTGDEEREGEKNCAAGLHAGELWCFRPYQGL